MTDERAFSWEATKRANARLTDEERAIGRRMLRTSDDYALLEWLVEDAAERGEVHGAELESLRAEVLTRKEEARGNFLAWKRRNGIPEPEDLKA